MNRRLILIISLVISCVIISGCQKEQSMGTGANQNSVQSATTSQITPSPMEKPSTSTITGEDALKRVQKIVGTPPDGWCLDLCNDDSVDGKDYYVAHFYEIVTDDPKTGAGHTATYGWYYIDKSNGEVYQEDIASGKLVKPTPFPEAKSISYKIYANERYGFSIEYPSTFVTKMLPDNGDGIKLGSPDGSAELTVSGMNNVLEDTVSSLLEDLVKEYNPSYKKQQDNWFVASWTEGDMIVYEKCVVGTESEDVFVFKYPASQKSEYDSIVSHLNSSFKTPAING